MDVARVCASPRCADRPGVGCPHLRLTFHRMKKWTSDYLDLAERFFSPQSFGPIDGTTFSTDHSNSLLRTAWELNATRTFDLPLCQSAAGSCIAGRNFSGWNHQRRNILLAAAFQLSRATSGSRTRRRALRIPSRIAFLAFAHRTRPFPRARKRRAHIDF